MREGRECVTCPQGLLMNCRVWLVMLRRRRKASSLYSNRWPNTNEQITLDTAWLRMKVGLHRAAGSGKDEKNQRISTKYGRKSGKLNVRIWNYQPPFSLQTTVTHHSHKSSTKTLPPPTHSLYWPGCLLGVYSLPESIPPSFVVPCRSPSACSA